MDLKPYIAAINKQKLQARGIVVLQKGEKIGEHRWIPEQPQNVFSVSKSFTSIALGMAIDEGTLALTSKVIDAFPDTVSKPGPRLEALTLEHLLTMSRGHPEFTRPGSVAEALSHELIYDPGRVFIYDNACTFLISAMITKATGMKVRDLLAERLFRPLGIPAPVWRESDDGFTLGATGLELSTGNLAVFGQFLLQRGNWKGAQLVSARWIDGATRTQIPTNNPHAEAPHPADYDLGYGYQFWTCRHGAYRADGKNGQFVVVFPRQEAVAAIISNEENMNPILYAVWDHILPQL